MEQPFLEIFEDVMPSEDAFGPHTRLARIIGNHILGSGRSGAIGLQGSWGSGKSAIIHFLRKLLPELNKESGERTKIFVFDAWSHEGDELRRSFLDELCQEIHTDDKERAKFRESIWQVKDTVSTRTTRRLTMGALFLALAIAAVPSSLALMELSKNEQLQISSNLVTFLVAVVCLPFIIIFLAVGKATVKAWLRSGTKTWGEVFRDEVSLIDADSSGELIAHTVRSAESSFQEFEEKLWTIVVSAAKTTDNLIVVIDNIDRLDPAKARRFWSSLAPFFDRAIRKNRSNNSQINVWLIVPFSRSHLCHVFEQLDRTVFPQGQEETREDGANENATTAGYIEKTFDIIFEVPPPILTDWRKYLEKLLLKRFPQLKEDLEELYAITKVFDLNKPDKVTPRALKTYVNKISVTHVQLTDTEEIPLRIVASFIQHRSSFDSLHLGSLQSLGRITANELAVLNEDQIELMLAAMYFGVSLAKAPQALMREPLLDALREVKPQILDDYSKFEGFNDVLYDAVLIELPRSKVTAQGISGVVETIASATETEISQRIWQYVAIAFSMVETWLGLSKKLPNTINAIIEHLHPASLDQFRNSVINTLENFSGFDAPGEGPLQSVARNWVQAAGRITNHIKNINIPDAPDFTFQVIAEALEEKMSMTHFPFTPTCSTLPLASLVKATRSPEVLLGIAKILNDNIPDVIESLPVASIAQEFDETPEMGKLDLQGNLVSLLASMMFSNNDHAVNHVNDLLQNGLLRHQLGAFSTDEDILACGLLATVLAHPELDFSDEVGQSPEGTEALEQVFENPKDHQEVLRRLGQLAAYVGQSKILYSQAAKFPKVRYAALYALREVSDGLIGMEMSAVETTSDPDFVVVISYIFGAEEECGFIRLLKMTGLENEFLDDLVELEFNPRNAYLHFFLVGLSTEIKHAGYLDFLIHGLDNVSVEEWENDLGQALNDDDSIASVASQVRSARDDFKLGNKVRDALTKAAQKINSAQMDPSSLAKDSIQRNLEGLDDTQRTLCEEEILGEILVSTSQKERDALYNTFRVGNFSENAVYSLSKELATLAENFLRDKDKAGLAWLLILMSDFPQLYSKAPRPRKNSIKERLVELIYGEEIDSELKNLAGKIYDVLGLKPKRKKENRKDS